MKPGTWYITRTKSGTKSIVKFIKMGNIWESVYSGEGFCWKNDTIQYYEAKNGWWGGEPVREASSEEVQEAKKEWIFKVLSE